jgi:hypothetical protein
LVKYNRLVVKMDDDLIGNATANLEQLWKIMWLWSCFGTELHVVNVGANAKLV